MKAFSSIQAAIEYMRPQVDYTFCVVYWDVPQDFSYASLKHAEVFVEHGLVDYRDFTPVSQFNLKTKEFVGA